VPSRGDGAVRSVLMASRQDAAPVASAGGRNVGVFVEAAIGSRGDGLGSDGDDDRRGADVRPRR